MYCLVVFSEAVLLRGSIPVGRLHARSSFFAPIIPVCSVSVPCLHMSAGLLLAVDGNYCVNNNAEGGGNNWATIY